MDGVGCHACFLVRVRSMDSGDTATHTCFLLHSLLNRQFSPEETRGHIGWHDSPCPFSSSGSARRAGKDSTDGMGCHACFFFKVSLIRSCVLLSLQDLWVVWVAVSVFLYFLLQGVRWAVESSCFFRTHQVARVAMPFSSSCSTDLIPPTDAFHFPDGSVEPSMFPRDCLELSLN